jgi:EmrB/QacA subfamily drug resistance transporter
MPATGYQPPATGDQLPATSHRLLRHMASIEVETIDYSRKWYVMVAVGTGIFLSTIDGSIVNIALPTLARSFDTNFSIVQWVVLSYLLAISTLMLGVGRLADMIGKKPIYTTGFIVFTAGSVLSGLAPGIYWLIGFRVVQAVGAAMILALGMAIITESFPVEERGRAIGISGSIVSIGIVLGPTVGGFLIDAASWRWIFFVNIPVGIAGTLLAWRFIPNIRSPGGQRFDYLGAVTFLISLLSLLLALTLGQQAGFTDRRVLLLFAAFVLFLVLFIYIERTAPQPMIDLALFKNSRFTVGLITGFITFVTIAGAIILMPFYLENVLGYDTRQVGLLLAVVPIGLGISAPISGSLSDRFGTRPITIIGLMILVFGYLTMSTLDTRTSAVEFLLLFLPLGIGMGVFQSPNNSAIMGSAPPGRLGIVSGMLAVTRTIGQTTGIAVMGAIWVSRIIFYAVIDLEGDAANASAEAQVTALQDTFLVMAFLMTAALALAVGMFIHERRRQAAAAIS